MPVHAEHRVGQKVEHRLHRRQQRHSAQFWWQRREQTRGTAVFAERFARTDPPARRSASGRQTMAYISLRSCLCLRHCCRTRRAEFIPPFFGPGRTKVHPTVEVLKRLRNEYGAPDHANSDTLPISRRNCPGSPFLASKFTTSHGNRRLRRSRGSSIAATIGRPASFSSTPTR